MTSDLKSQIVISIDAPPLVVEARGIAVMLDFEVDGRLNTPQQLLRLSGPQTEDPA